MTTSSVPSPVVSAPSNSAQTVANAVASKNTIASNFTTFLQLLTTQLKNQSPLDPLDTNQFTQQLVQFAQVEQQINMNTSLTSLLSLQRSAQQTAALGFIGASVTVDGSTAQLSGGKAQWNFSTARAATATVNVTDATGQVAYSGTFPVDAGGSTFVWDGRGNSGEQWPDGRYTISITAKDATGQTVAVATEVTGTVDSVDMTQDPPMLSVDGQYFPLDRIKSIKRS